MNQPLVQLSDNTEHIRALFVECLRRYSVDSQTGLKRDVHDVVRMATRTLRKNGYTEHQIAAALVSAGDVAA